MVMRCLSPRKRRLRWEQHDIQVRGVGGSGGAERGAGCGEGEMVGKGSGQSQFVSTPSTSTLVLEFCFDYTALVQPLCVLPDSRHRLAFPLKALPPRPTRLALGHPPLQYQVLELGGVQCAEDRVSVS